MQKQSQQPIQPETIAQDDADDHSIDIEQELTKGFAAKLIRRKAKQLLGRAGFTRSDRPDLEQEMKLRVWQRFAQFDSRKAHWNAFVTTVVERHVATILQTARRIKRLEGETLTSLSELVEDCDNELAELDDTISPEHKEPLTGRYVATSGELCDLKLDVAEVMANLPDDLRELCELLKFHNVKDAAREMGIPRTTASSMVSRLRQIFVDAGFEESFPESSSRGGETR